MAGTITASAFGAPGISWLLEGKNALCVKSGSPSPDELKPKLNLMRVRDRRIELARSRNVVELRGVTGGILRRLRRMLRKNRQVVERRSKVRVIEDIEYFGAELDAEGLGDPLHRNVFEQGEINFLHLPTRYP